MIQMIHDNNAFLTKNIIFDLVEKGIIVIEPFNEKNLGNVSYDCELDNEFRQTDTGNKIVRINNETDYKNHTKIFRPEDGLIALAPGETIIGRTKEIIALPNNIIGAIDGRSRFARLFIVIHSTAMFIQPDTQNRQVLEISNIGRNTIELEIKGLKICQIYFMRCSGSASHTGRYTNETDW